MARPGLDIVVRRAMAPADIAAVETLLAAAERADGQPALDDHQRLELAHGGRPGFAAVEAWDGGAHPIAYAQVSRGNQASELELVVDPHHRAAIVDLGLAVVGRALDVVRAEGGGMVHWWVSDPTGAAAGVAERLGLQGERRLHQMRRPLPAEPPAITTRPFVVGQDEAAWLAVNNRAFASHPEQGGWAMDELAAREAAPWFDPAGFRLYEEDGRLLGFCWTKVHADHDPVLGEIYVIGVDPDAHGRGLGRQLTLAGLASLAGRGVPVGMLYVDGENAAALAMYERLGFTIHHTRHAYGADLR